MATKKNVVSMKQDVPAQLEVLRADVANLAEAIKLQAKATVAEKKSTIKDVTAEKTELVKDRYSELSTKAETSIQENPLTSIAVAVGAGIVLGALLRR
ncbi:YqjD family protein [Litorimonas sp. RW-G-Af-16]|uniref:DUF883 family protein n=1 Tax=Litorimonas sp. RW-G-Af-16 TaxID=3241168 RepID=UPI00390C45C0